MRAITRALKIKPSNSDAQRELKRLRGQEPGDQERGQQRGQRERRKEGILVQTLWR